MKNLPSNKVVFLTILSILIYLTIDFQNKAKNNFFQLNYNWSEIKTIESFTNVKLDSISYDYLRLINNNTIAVENLSSYSSYAINDNYYFRCVSISKGSDTIEFKGVYWINGKPKQQTKIFNFSIVNLELNKKGNHTVSMIGDSQLIWLDLKYLRRDMSQKLENIKFVGNNSDVFGFNHSVELLNNSERLLNEIDQVPQSETYILFVGAHEEKVLQTKKNLRAIINNLLQRKSKIILVSPPHYKAPNSEKSYQNIKTVYKEFEKNDNIDIIDLEKLAPHNTNIFMADGIHLNPIGQDILTVNLISALK